MAHAARRLPVLQTAAVMCAARAAGALRVLAGLTGDLGAASGAFALWTTALLVLAHVAERHGSSFVARPLFALAAKDEGT